MYPWLNQGRKLWAKLSLWLSGIFYSIEWKAKLNKKQSYIFCPNHTSYIDITIVALVAHGSFHFMGKKELLRNPVLRLFFKTIDIPVDRKSKMSSFKAFKMASENLKKGMSIILFPEGKIPDNLPHLGNFKSGAFKMAVENNTPIVPVTFLDNWRIFPDNGVAEGTRPGITRIVVHEPILIAQQTEDELKHEVFRIIDNELKQDHGS